MDGWRQVRSPFPLPMLDWITTTISSFGYGGIILLMALENLIPPIPSEVIMPLAGFTVTQGNLHLGAAIAAGTVGSLLGAFPWYLLGRRLSERRLRAWIERYGHWLTLSGDDLDRSKRWFRTYGGGVVLFGRLIPGIRTYISIPAGLEDMAFLPFLLFSTVGTLGWVSLLTYVGYVLGDNYQAVERFVAPVSAVAIALILIATAYWFLHRRRRR